jgi:hypothetical protein
VSPFDQRWFARAVVALAVIVGAIALLPELDIARVDLNDSVFHLTIADRLVQRLAAGRSPLDFWMPEWSFGFPVLRDYQPLGHWLVALGHFATFRQVPVDVVFTFLRWLLLATFPLSAYAGSRMVPLRRSVAAAVALLAPLISAPNLYGIDYSSYVWRGAGLYTQLVAMHLFVLAIGAGCRAIREGRRVALAGLLLALTFLAHFIYGYMAAATLVLAAALPSSAPARRRFVRLLAVAVVSFAVSAFQLLPMLADSPFINRSRWEPAWKWDSFGLTEVFSLTASGDLLDGGRLPVLSLLALAGAVAAFRRRRLVDDDGDGDERFMLLFALSGAALWLFLFCGRAAWGPLLPAIGLGDVAQVHRVVGAAQWFLLMLAAIGLARLWELPRARRWRYPTAAAIALSLVVLSLPLAERRAYLQEGYGWGRDNLARFESARSSVDAVTADAQRLGGRTYPGLAAGWGGQLRVGYVPLYAFMSEAHVPAVAFLYHAMALPADVMIRFDENRAEQYRLFDIRSVVADAAQKLPAFLRPIATHAPFCVYQPPAAGGAFDMVRAPYVFHVDRRTFYDVNDAWLKSGWPAARLHVILDHEGAVPLLPLPHLSSVAAFAQPAPVASCGSVLRESGGDDAKRAEVEVNGDACVALLKTTFHPNWRATVDGVARQTLMLSPGFIGVALPRGRHVVELRYEPGVAKGLLLALAPLLLAAAFLLERRGWFARVEDRAEALRPRWTATHTWALVAFAIVLPCVVPYSGRAQPSGHDALEYLPRVVEFHENLRHGILLPRWAPDLSAGQGQPLFLLNPPLFYYVTEAFHLGGLAFVPAMNAACVFLILAAAAAMFLLGRWYFGPAGGAIAAAAYVWAPYFLVDLYVRTAFAEFSAFPFYPLVFYGLARHAAERRRKWLVVALVSYAGVWFAHTPSAVLFSPLAGAFVVFLAWRRKSVGLLATHVATLAAGLLLAATIWLPSIVEAPNTHSNLLTEGPLKYSNHFVAPAQFFSTMWGYGVSVPGPDDGMPFQLGWPLLLVGAAGAIAIVRSRQEAWKEWIAFMAGAAAVLCYLMTARAHAVWDAIPQLQYVAFPWRLLAPVTFCLAIAAASVTLAIEQLEACRRPLAIAAVLAVLVLPSLDHAKPAGYLSLDETLWSPAEIASHNVVAATFDTFEPKWVQVHPLPAGGRILVTRGSAAARVLDKTPEHLLAIVTAVTDADLELPIAYFPGWHIRLDDVEQPVDRPAANGRIRLATAAGTHRVEAEFERTPALWLADLLSFLGLIIAVALWMTRRAE